MSRAATYGPGDRLDTMTDPTGLTTFSYDAVGRPTGRSHPFGSQTQERDALGRVRRQELTVPAQSVLTNPFETLYEYDEEGRLLWMRDRRGKTVELRYDALGRLTWLNHGQTTCDGGATTQTFGPSTSWTYDDRDRIESVVHRGPRPSSFVLGPILVSRTYERNAAGEPERITNQDGSATEVDYDPAGRVEAERTFDALGGLTEETTYLYDLDGNRKKKTSSAGVEDYVYDSGSRLTQVLLDGVETQRFEYDENGRVSRIVSNRSNRTLVGVRQSRALGPRFALVDARVCPAQASDCSRAARRLRRARRGQAAGRE